MDRSLTFYHAVIPWVCDDLSISVDGWFFCGRKAWFFIACTLNCLFERIQPYVAIGPRCGVTRPEGLADGCHREADWVCFSSLFDSVTMERARRFANTLIERGFLSGRYQEGHRQDRTQKAEADCTKEGCPKGKAHHSARLQQEESQEIGSRSVEALGKAIEPSAFSLQFLPIWGELRAKGRSTIPPPALFLSMYTSF
jgi:hypothetical protein